MMKQTLLKTIALGLMAMVGVSAWAERDTSKPVYCPVNDGSYDDIYSALEAIKSNAATELEIQLWSSCSLRTGQSDAEYRITCPENKTLSIVPMADDITVTRGNHNRGKIWFLVNKATSTLKIGSDSHALTIASNGSTSKIINAVCKREKGLMTLNNITFSNFVFEESTTEGFIFADRSDAGVGPLILKDITVSNCTTDRDAFIKSTVNSADVVYLQGSLQFTNCTGTHISVPNTIRLGEVNGTTASTITIAENTPITIKWGGNTSTIGTTIVKYATSAMVSNFELTNSGLCLFGDNTDLKLTQFYTLNVPESGLIQMTLPFAATIPGSVNLYTQKTKENQYVPAYPADVTTTTAASTKYLVKADEGTYKFVSTATSGSVESTADCTEAAPSKVAYIATSAVAVKVVNGTTLNGYSTWSSAWDAATEGDNLIVNADIEISSTVDFTKNVTIVPASSGLTITRPTTFGNNILFNMKTTGKSATIGSTDYAMTIDGKTTSSSTSLVECTYGALNMTNLIIKDAYTSQQRGLVNVKQSGTLYLTDVVFTNCQSTYATTPQVIFCGKENALVLSGDNKFINCTNGTNSIYDIVFERKIKVSDSGITNTTPISLYASNTTNIPLNGTAVSNATSDEVSKFVMMTAGYGLFRTDDGRGDIKVCEGYPMTIGDAGAATLMLPFQSTIPANVACYKLTYTSGTDINTTGVTSGTLAANTPVLVIAAKGFYNFKNSSNKTDGATSYTASATYSSGVLTGVYQETVVPANNYILTNHSGNVGFRKADGTTNKVKAYRAYMTATPPNAPEFMGINFDGNVTAIEAVEKKDVMDDGEIYNLQGVRMTGINLPKGIYVKNGKKFVVK